MIIKELDLTRYRCYDSQKIIFSEGLNILWGDNAVGKTTIAEAVHYLSLLKSNHEYRDSNVVKKGFDEAEITGRFCENGASFFAKLLISNQAKEIYKNGNPIKKLKDYIGTVNLVSFFPDSSLNFFASPSYRRREFDLLICQISPNYLDQLSCYKRLLKERNAVLKNDKSLPLQSQVVLLDIIDPQIIECGKNVMDGRQKVIDKIATMSKKFHNQISSSTEEMIVKYTPCVCLAEYEKSFYKSRNEDLMRRLTTKGPHRDDYSILINGMLANENCSQGQRRNAIISIKLAEIEIIREIKHSNPIVLLDDVFGELDQKRQNQLIQTLGKNVQTFITTTNINQIDSSLLADARIIHISKGSVTYE